jgi:hypothetical protein
MKKKKLKIINRLENFFFNFYEINIIKKFKINKY